MENKFVLTDSYNHIVSKNQKEIQNAYQKIEKETQSWTPQELLKRMLSVWKNHSIKDALDKLIDEKEKTKENIENWKKDDSDLIQQLSYINIDMEENDNNYKKDQEHFVEFFEKLSEINSCADKIIFKTVNRWLLSGIKLETLKFFDDENPMFQLIEEIEKDFLNFCKENYQLIDFFLRTSGFMENVIAEKNKFFIRIHYIWQKITEQLVFDYLENELKNVQ